jgi:hypothetical protein
MKYRFVRDEGDHRRGDVVDGMRLKDVRRLIQERIVEGADEKEEETPPRQPVQQSAQPNDFTVPTTGGTPGGNTP